MSHEETVLPLPETVSHPFTTRRQNYDCSDGMGDIQESS